MEPQPDLGKSSSAEMHTCFITHTLNKNGTDADDCSQRDQQQQQQRV